MPNHPETLKDIYSQRFSKDREYRVKVWQAICSGFFSQYIPDTAIVLDLGTGWGEFINNIQAAEKFAMDLNPDTRKHLSSEVRFIHQDCSQPWPLESESLDVVFTSNFLEHLFDKASIERAVAEAFRCLKKSGKIICLGPNIKLVTGAYWDFWDHHIPLTEQSCSELLKITGFSVELACPRFLPYTMSSGKNPPHFFVSLYLKFPLLWRFIGKQFLVVGRKPT